MKSIVNNIVASRSEAEKVVDKIIEFEILDPVWFEVLRRHPELQVDENGKTIPLKRNHLINHFYSRSNTIEIVETCTGIVSIKDLMITTSITGILRVLDSSSGLELKNMNLFDKPILHNNIPTDFIYAPMSHFHIVGSIGFDESSIISNDTVNSSTIPEETLTASISIKYQPHSRYILMNIVSLEPAAVEEPIDTTAAAKKKPPPKGSVDPSLEKKFFYRVLIIDVLQGTEGSNSLIHIDIVHELFYEVPITSVDNIYSTSQTIFDKISIEFNLNGYYITVLGSALGDSCKIYSLKPPSSIIEGKEDSSIDQETAAPTPIVVAVPNIIAILPPTANILESSRLKRVSIVPNYSNIIKQQKVKKNVDTSNEIQKFAESNMLVVSLHATPKMLILGLRYKSEEEIAAKSAPLLDAKGKPIVAKVDPKAPAPVVQEPTVAIDLYLLSEFKLTSPISVYDLDHSLKVLLVTGTSDGSVTLWNLAELSMIDCLGKHSNAVTCLSIQRNYSPNLTALTEAKVHIISGAADGTLCFFETIPNLISSSTNPNQSYSNHKNNKNEIIEKNIRSDHTKKRMNSSKILEPRSSNVDLNVKNMAKNTVEHVGLVDYRDDIHKAAVLDIIRHDYLPLIYVHYSNGMMLMYDTLKNALIGRLEKRERINFMNVFTTMISWHTLRTFEDPLKKAAAIKKAAEMAAAAELLRIQTAALEAEKAKKAGKPIPEVVVPITVTEQSVIVEPMEVKEEIVIEPLENEINLVPYPIIIESFYQNHSFTSDLSWYSYRFLSTMSSNHIICLSERNSKPCLVMYSLDAIYQEAKKIMLQSNMNNSVFDSNSKLLSSIPTTAATSGVIKPSHQIKQNMTTPNTNRNNLSIQQNKRVQDTFNHLDHQMTTLDNKGTLIPIEQLRLTEERLHALENTFHKPYNNMYSIPNNKVSNTTYQASYDQILERDIKNNLLNKDKHLHSIEYDPFNITKLEMIRSKNEREKRKLKIISNNKNLISILSNTNSIQ